MDYMFYYASAFNGDIGNWAVHSVTRMDWMFSYASAFDQDLGWCVADGLDLRFAFYKTTCASTFCGVSWGGCDIPSNGNVMANGKIRIAVAAWLSDATAAEATYGHISTWETGGVTHMEELFEGASSFNEDISAWDASGVTNMHGTFRGASSFDQDLGWCLDEDVDLEGTFDDTPCESTSCGVLYTAALSCGGTPMGDSSIRTAVAAWLSNATA